MCGRGISSLYIEEIKLVYTSMLFIIELKKFTLFFKIQRRCYTYKNHSCGYFCAKFGIIYSRESETLHYIYLNATYHTGMHISI